MSTENELILKEIRELREQVSLNCNKLDVVTEKMSELDKKVSDNGKDIECFYRSFSREIGRIQTKMGITPFKPE